MKEEIHVLRLFVVWLKHLMSNMRLDERAYIEAMNIRNKKETKSMLSQAIHQLKEEFKDEWKVIGAEEASMTIAERMLEKKLSWNLIIEMTGVTQERYGQWKKSEESVMSAA